MIADFATQMVEPPRVRCIGVELQPFSLGHYLILREMGNAFLVPKCVPPYEHFSAAAFVCAHTWEQYHRLNRWYLQWWMLLQVRAWGRMAKKFNVLKEILSLKDYIQSQMDLPEKARSRGGTRYLFSDWETRLFCYLRSIGYTESQALNMPLSRANLMFCAHLEESGTMEFKSRRQYSVEDRMTRIVEEMEKADKADKEGFAA